MTKKISYYDITIPENPQLFQQQLDLSLLNEDRQEAKLNTFNESLEINRIDYRLYQAVLQNPLDIPMVQEQMAIYIVFKKGECATTNYIEVYDSNNDLVPFQWEADKHPNPSIDDDFGSYDDGSLKCGYLWLIASLSPGESKVFTIRVYDKERLNTYPERVLHNVIQSTPGTVREELIANNVGLRFHEDLGFLLRHVFVNGIDLVGGTVLQRVAIKNNTYSDINSNVTTETTNINRTVSGSGVVFKDYISSFKYKYNEGITVTSTVRLWANGKFDMHFFVRADADIAAGVLNGVAFKLAMQKSGEVSGEGYKGIKVGDTSLLTQIKYFQYIPDNNPAENRYSAQVLSSNDAGFTYMNATWYNTSPKTMNIPNGSYYSAKFHFTTGTDVAVSKNVTDTVNRLMNTPRSVATKESKEVLRRKAIALSKVFINLNAEKALTETNFPLLRSLIHLAYAEINGIDNFDTSWGLFKSALDVTYGGGTVTGIFGVYPNRGLEYIGRDMSALEYFRAKCAQKGKVKELEFVESVIHALADAIVLMEEFSGGNGKITLSTLVSDNMNAEACALRYLKSSLNLQKNPTREAAYNRVKVRFESGPLYKNILPYAIGQEVFTQQLSHYHGFSLFDYTKAVSIPSFHIYNYLLDYSTPAGFIKEVGYNYINSRWGFVHTAFYSAVVLYRAGTISSLQQSCAILEHVISRCYPNGYHEYPLDGWKPNQESSVSIECQIVCELVLDEILLYTNRSVR
ncbi:hypothetical protein [Paenibacillus sp. PDC88]|uniref:hypothetical protein n=1 Tax=Paenibacillus sp. PDC88 TaxID=1884375 RepID=UPI000899F8AD|nr:hypothetical protein [Paenibacillus sp. PDC88]SDW22476.1 hypothetical protein SAMN05518848_101710 [Paenibacillus sp. PDC88]